MVPYGCSRGTRRVIYGTLRVLEGCAVNGHEPAVHRSEPRECTTAWAARAFTAEAFALPIVAAEPVVAAPVTQCADGRPAGADHLRRREQRHAAARRDP